MKLSEEYISNALSNDENILEKSKELSQDIQIKNIDIAQLVEILGSTLTSKETDERKKAMELLSSTISNLSPDFLNPVQLNFIVTFYCDRSKDHQSIAPSVISGILAISAMKYLPESSCNKLLNSMFQNITCQSQSREDRGKIYNMIKIMTELHKKELTAMGSDFVYGVINFIDGERDPRNLMFLYEFLPIFITNFPLHHLSEEMFDIFSSYFPIHFFPSPNDPAALTRESLAEALAICLCSSKEFSDSCLSLLLEKLESELVVAKMDSLYLLVERTRKFEIKDILSRFEEIWSIVRPELISGTNKQISEMSLYTIEKILIASSTDDDVCKSILDIVFNSLIVSLMDTNEIIFRPASKISLACSGSNEFASIYVAEKLLPAYFELFENSSNNIKCILLDAIERILSNCQQKNTIGKINQEYLKIAEQKFVESICRKDQDDLKLKVVGFQSIKNMSSNISESSRMLVYAAIVDVLISGENTAVTDCLIELAAKYPSEVNNNIVKLLYTTELDDLESQNNIFKSVCSLTNIEFFSADILKFVQTNIFEPKSPEYQLLMLNNLSYILEFVLTTKSIQNLYENDKIFERLFSLAHNSTLKEETYLIISTILRLIIKNLDINVQTEVVNTFLKTVDLTKPVDLYLTYGVIGHIEKNVNIDTHFEKLVNDLTHFSLTSSDEKLRTNVCHHLLCSMFNKFSVTDIYKNALNKVLSTIKMEILQSNSKAVEILSWITKGLLLKGHEEAADIINTLIELLEHPTLSNVASMAFEVISYEIPSLHLPICKFLYKQKLFQQVLSSIISKIDNLAEAHLNALVFVFKIAPHKVLQMNIEEVGKILLKCLDLTQKKPLINTLNILKRFLLSTEAFFENYINILVAKLLKLSKFNNAMDVRICSIECIRAMTTYPSYILTAVKQDILMGLVTALDDHKRLVRAEAVKTRTAWFLLGSPVDNSK